jgi:hypothetical protein
MLQLLPSPHAVVRAKERAGWCRHALARMLERALYDGLEAGECGRALRSYLTDLTAGSPNRFARVYGQHVFIFGKDGTPDTATLVTVLHLPHELRVAAQRAKQSRYWQAA